MKAIKIPKIEDRRWKSWGKIIRSVDPQKKGGWAFEGEWVPRNREDLYREIPVGEDDLILLYDERGSRKYHAPFVRLMVVQGEELRPICEPIKGWDWAISAKKVALDFLRKKKGKRNWNFEEIKELRNCGSRN